MALSLAAERKRIMPLVPELMKQSMSRQSLFFGRRPFAQKYGCFCPDLDDRDFCDSMSEDQLGKFSVRVVTLQKHAQQNASFDPSEYTWEADAWHDVFGIFRDDERLRIRDKRPYEYAETDEKGTRNVVKRTPDATIGLRSYDETDLEKGFTCVIEDCKEDHSVMQPLESLSKERIKTQMYARDCGLVVDGRWGEASLLFPFAVYEAKKKTLSYEAAEQQVYDACAVYLGMLDDLARDPSDVTKYQSNESQNYQMFAFTSCGHVWRFFIAYYLAHSCLVETLWEGDIRLTRNASQLTCIMTQVRDYAVNQHRNFVSRHLEPWLIRGAKLKDTSITRSWEEGQSSTDDTDADTEKCSSQGSENGDEKGDKDKERKRNSNFNDEECEWDKGLEDLRFSLLSPEWLSLKQRTQDYRSTKAAETRKRNAKNKQEESAILRHSEDIPAELQRRQQTKRSIDETHPTKALQRPPKKSIAVTSEGRPSDSERWRKAFQKFAAEDE